MDDLVAFLRARLAEDEQTARAVAWDRSGNSLSWELAASATVEVGDDEFNTDDRTVANHIVNNDPARVLAEVGAKRRIVDRYAGLREHGDTGDAAWILPLLASAHSAHPDYRPEWAPAA